MLRPTHKKPENTHCEFEIFFLLSIHLENGTKSLFLDAFDILRINYVTEAMYPFRSFMQS